MKHNRNLILAVLLFSLCCSFGCGDVKNGADEPAPDLKVFPAQEVCGYPANSSIKKFHFLGGGTWQPLSPDDPDVGFGCGTSRNVVQLFGKGEDSVNVEYSATGAESGPTMISVEYSVSASIPIENESVYRNVYSRFLDEISQQALKQPLPELAEKKISNLNSYSALETASDENFFIGDGFINLSRNRSSNNSTIVVRAQIYPDKALKLE